MPALGEVSAASVRFWKEPGASHLRAEVLDRLVVLDARVKRLFPLSQPDQQLVIQDGAGDEVARMPNLEGLDPISKELLESELDRRYFTPIIERIHRLENQRGMWRFEVETHRGRAEFFVRNWRDSSHEMRAGRWQITSVDGQRYEITNVDELDQRSQRFLDQLL